jgi:hypothetical protein
MPTVPAGSCTIRGDALWCSDRHNMDREPFIDLKIDDAINHEIQNDVRIFDIDDGGKLNTRRLILRVGDGEAGVRIPVPDHRLKLQDGFVHAMISRPRRSR